MFAGELGMGGHRFINGMEALVVVGDEDEFDESEGFRAGRRAVSVRGHRHSVDWDACGCRDAAGCRVVGCVTVESAGRRRSPSIEARVAGQPHSSLSAPSNPTPVGASALI